jgi:hypothetical protein
MSKAPWLPAANVVGGVVVVLLLLDPTRDLWPVVLLLALALGLLSVGLYARR